MKSLTSGKCRRGCIFRINGLQIKNHHKYAVTKFHGAAL